MDDPAIQVRPIRCMMGPHHLNEVFFDDLRVTEADVLGTVDDGWSIVQDVMSFERVGIARYARCERLLAAAPSVLGDRWDELPAELRGRWVRMLTHCRRARLLAYRVVSTAEQRAHPARRRRRVPHRGHQAGPGQRGGADGDRRRGAARTTRGRAGSSARSKTTGATRRPPPSSSGSIEMQRILLSRALLAARNERMILDLGDDAKEYGRQALRAFEAAGGDQLVQQAEAKPDIRESLVGPSAGELGAWELDPRTDADGLEAAAALCRSAGYWALPYPVAERLARADRPRRRRPDRGRRHATGRRRGGPRDALGGSDIGRRAAARVVGQGAAGPGVRRPSSNCPRSTRTARATSRSGWCCRAGRCSGCSTVRWN